MDLTFAARIDGRLIRCEILADRDLTAPVFCFSLMAPGAVVEGGFLIRSVAGYCEVQLPDLIAGRVHALTLSHARAEFAPTNRAWLPLGGYLRHAGGCTALPVLPAGVRPSVPAGSATKIKGTGLLPPPKDWHPGVGVLDASRGFATDAEPFAAVAALRFPGRPDLSDFLGAGPSVTILTDPDLPPEGYRLTVAPDGVTVAAAGSAGRFYAAVTLRHLQILHGGRLPCGEITDAPKFGWRGQHLDCARHFFAVETILDLLDAMALFKLNRFHWHFADDEAFRLEVECLPDLWRKTAFRGEGELVPGVFGGGIRSGGSYSKADVARVLAHATRLNIEVLPEIEVPAHAFALNLALPGLRDRAENGREASVQGYAENVVNPALPRTWEVLEALADEVADLFPFGHLHLGCDELPHDTWGGSPAVARLKEAEGLVTTDDVQGWMMERLARKLADRGIRPMAWEEAARGANGGIGNRAILQSWTGQGPGIAAARAGYDVIMSPAQHIYLDMAHSPDPDDWGASWAAFVPLAATVNWQVIPQGAEDIAPRVIGIEGTFWGEFTTQDADLWPMLFPRLLGLASKAWQGDGGVTGGEVATLARAYAQHLATPGYWHHLA